MTRTFPLDSRELQRWALDVERAGNPSEIVQFAKTFSQHVKHVSFDTFSRRLFKVAREIVDAIKEEAPPKVYLLIDGSLDKSNTWAALLAWPTLREVVTDVISLAIDIPDEDWEDGCAIIHPDDMSYSGTQMALAMSSIEKERLGPDSRYYLLIPYLGQEAKRRLSKVSRHLRVSGSTRVVGTLSYWLRKDGYDSEKIVTLLEDRLEPWRVRYGAQGTHNLIYFDHKLADALSIPNKMLAALYVFDQKGKVTATYHPIEGCEDAVYKDKWTGEELNPELQVGDFDPKATCPLAFYKSIPYRFRRQVLKHKTMQLLRLLNNMDEE